MVVPPLDDSSKMRPPATPGLAKVRRVQALARRSFELVGVREGWFSSLLEHADIVSEGAVQEVDGTSGYFGSTSLRCLVAGLDIQPRDPSALADLVLKDPNARLRLLRLAHREAASRAVVSLGVLTAEITAIVTAGEAGDVLAVHIDVSADLVESMLDDDERNVL